jgi:hypothetical protein
LNKILTFLFFILIFVSACKEETVIPAQQWSLTDSEFSELLILSDTSTFTNYNDFSIRIERIQDIFAGHQDPRGTFTTLYEHITYSVLASMEDGRYNDPQFVGDFGVAFGKRYLVNLRNHLLSQPVTYSWTNFYDLCEIEKPFSRLVLSGMNAHITKDLLDALVSINITTEKESDWILISAALVEGLDEFQEAFETDYELDIDDLIALYGFGTLLDDLFGEGATVYTIVHELRMAGFEDALRYQSGLEDEMNYKTRQKFLAQENIIELADGLGLLP